MGCEPCPGKLKPYVVILIFVGGLLLTLVVLMIRNDWAKFIVGVITLILFILGDTFLDAEFITHFLILVLVISVC